MTHQAVGDKWSLVCLGCGRSRTERRTYLRKTLWTLSATLNVRRGLVGHTFPQSFRWRRPPEMKYEPKVDLWVLEGQPVKQLLLSPFDWCLIKMAKQAKNGIRSFFQNLIPRVQLYVDERPRRQVFKSLKDHQINSETEYVTSFVLIS